MGNAPEPTAGSQARKFEQPVEQRQRASSGVRQCVQRGAGFVVNAFGGIQGKKFASALRPVVALADERRLELSSQPPSLSRQR